VVSKSKFNSKKFKEILVLKCDYCGKIFEKRFATWYSQKENHFCSRICANTRPERNEHLSRVMKIMHQNRTDEERLVVSEKVSKSIKKWNDNRTEEEKRLAYEKTSKTLNNKTNDEKQKRARKFKKTWHNRSEDEKKAYSEKQRRNTKLRWNNKTEEDKQKWAEMSKERLNNRTKEERIRDINRIKAGLNKRTKKQIEEANKKRKETISKDPDFHRKRIKKTQQTRKKRYGEGDCFAKSEIESIYYEYLLFWYSEDEIERQSFKNGWIMDFYIIPENTYVNFNGDYWHGKDQTHNDLMKKAIIYEKKNNLKKSQYRKIASTILIDQKKIDYFKEQNIPYQIIWEYDFKEFLNNSPMLKENLGKKMENRQV